MCVCGRKVNVSLKVCSKGASMSVSTRGVSESASDFAAKKYFFLQIIIFLSLFPSLSLLLFALSTFVSLV